MHEKSYEAVSRAPGSFDDAWRGIKLLLENKVPFVVKGTLLVPTLGEVEEFEAWAATLPAMDRPPRYSMFLDLRCRRDSEERNRLIKKIRISPEEGIKFLTRDREHMIKICRSFAPNSCILPETNLSLRCRTGRRMYRRLWAVHSV